MTHMPVSKRVFRWLYVLWLSCMLVSCGDARQQADDVESVVSKTESVLSARGLQVDLYNLPSGASEPYGYTFTDGKYLLDIQLDNPREYSVVYAGKDIEKIDILSDTGLGLSLTQSEKPQPLRVRGLTGDMRNGANAAARIAGRTLKHRAELTEALPAEVIAVLEDIASRRFAIQMELSSSLVASGGKLYRGKTALPYLRVMSSSSGLGWLRFCAWPEHFVVLWGPGINETFAYYWDGLQLSAIERKDPEPEFTESQVRKYIYEDIEWLAAASKSGAFESPGDDVDAQLQSVVQVLSANRRPVRLEPRIWSGIGELVEIFLSNPEPVEDEGELWRQETESHKLGDYEVEASPSYGDFVSVDCARGRLYVSRAPSGLYGMLFVERKRKGASSALLNRVRSSLVLTDKVLEAELPKKGKLLFDTAREMAAGVLQYGDRLEEVVALKSIDLLRKVADGKFSVEVIGNRTTSFNELLRAVEGDRNYGLEVRRGTLVPGFGTESVQRVYAGSGVSVLELVGPRGKTWMQVRFVGDQLFAWFVRDEPVTRVSDEVKELARMVGAMVDNGALEPPDFARKALGGLLAAIAEQETYDDVKDISSWKYVNYAKERGYE